MPILLALVALFVIGILLVKLVRSVLAGVVHLLPGFLALMGTVAIWLAAVAVLVCVVWILATTAKRRAARSLGRSTPRVPANLPRAESVRSNQARNRTGASGHAAAIPGDLWPRTAYRGDVGNGGQEGSMRWPPLPPLKPREKPETRAAGRWIAPAPVVTPKLRSLAGRPVPKHEHAVPIETLLSSEVSGDAPVRRAAITVTVIVSGPGRLTGATDVPIRLIRSDSVDVVAIGDHTEVGCATTYVIKRMHVDLDGFWRDLPRQARDALLDVVANPQDDAAIHRFQRILDTEPMGDLETAAELPAARDIRLNLGDCDVVVYGDHNDISADSRVVIARATMPIDHLLKTSDLLVRRFAEAVTDPSALRAFGRALHEVENDQPSERFLACHRLHDTDARISDGVVDADDILALPIGEDTRYTHAFKHKVKYVDAVPNCDLDPIRTASAATEDVRTPGIGLAGF